jgi:hypothetical protein
MSDIRIGKVRFIDAPKGEAPLEIRRCWVGLEVPCFCYQDQPSFDPDDGSFGVIGKEKQKFEPCYIINQGLAIEELARVHPHAAEFWNNIGFPQSPFAVFSFNEGCVEVIEPVMSYQELVFLGEVN